MSDPFRHDDRHDRAVSPVEEDPGVVLAPRKLRRLVGEERFDVVDVVERNIRGQLRVELLRRQDCVGTLTPGKLADIVAFRGDPLADISLMEKPEFVMKDGVVYKSGGKALY